MYEPFGNENDHKIRFSHYVATYFLAAIFFLGLGVFFFVLNDYDPMKKGAEFLVPAILMIIVSAIFWIVAICSCYNVGCRQCCADWNNFA